MIIEQATVVAFENGIATVQCQAKNSCGGCSAVNGCGTKSLSALAGEKHAPRFDLAVNETLSPGDQVRLGLPEHTLLFGVIWLYCLPLAALILSTLGLSQIFSHELLVAFGAISLTALTFFVVKKQLNRQQKHAFEPIYLGKI